jgi:hypothetical protein
MVVTHGVFGYTVHAKVVTNGLHGRCEMTGMLLLYGNDHEVKLCNVSPRMKEITMMMLQLDNMMIHRKFHLMVDHVMTWARAIVRIRM